MARQIRFIALSLSILLAGALAAGFAARAVVAPRTGEPVNAGVLPVPSVLGQTAEEVLFYPWSAYDALNLLPYSTTVEQELTAAGQEDAQAVLSAYAQVFSNVLSPFRTLFGAEYDDELLFHAVELGQSDQLGNPLFLKDYPASGPEGTQLLLSFAWSAPLSQNGSVSYLVKPARPEALSQQRQDQALARVRADLEALLRLEWEEGGEPELFLLLTRYYDAAHSLGLSYEPLGSLGERLKTARYYLSLAESEADEAFAAEMEPEALPLDEALERLEHVGGCTVQLISTPTQIVLLFTGPDRAVVGAYYDIQLERYSGIGLSGG